MPYKWIEEDFITPPGVRRLDQLPEPQNNKKYVMYHGTTRRTAQLIKQRGFQPGDGPLGHGIYLSRDLEKARCYPTGCSEDDKAIIKVIVDVGKVINIDFKDHQRQKNWYDKRHKEVYDTAWAPPNCGIVSGGLEMDCVRSSSQITNLTFIEPHYTDRSGGQAGHSSASGAGVQWSEDDEVLPEGVGRLDLPKPESNNKYVMYHGTSSQAAESIRQQGFHRSADGTLGPGVYLSRDREKASSYPKGRPIHHKVVFRVEVDVGKVIFIEGRDHPRQKNWHDSRHGEVYDTAWLLPNDTLGSGQEETCVWDPQRIRIMKTIKPAWVSS